VGERIKYIITGSGTISLVLDGTHHSIDPAHPNYLTIKDGLATKDADLLVKAVDASKKVKPKDFNFYDKEFGHCLATVGPGDKPPCKKCSARAACYGDDEEDE